MKKLLLFISILIVASGFSLIIPFRASDDAIYDQRGFIYAFTGRIAMAFDVSNPARIDFRTFEIKDTYYKASTVCNEKLYISTYTGHILIYDVRNGLYPNLVKDIDTEWKSYAMACVDGIVYAIDPETMRIIKDEEIVKIVKDGARVSNKWWVEGDYLFVQGEEGGFVVIDISDRMSPKVVRRVGGYGKVAGRGEWAYFAGMSDFLAIDVSNPRAPRTVNVIDMQEICDVTFRKGKVHIGPVVRDVEIVGNYLAVVFTWTDGDYVATLSLKDPSYPKLVKKEKISGKYDFAEQVVSDGKAFLYVFLSSKVIVPYRVKAEEVAIPVEYPTNPQSALVVFEGGGSGWYRVAGKVKVYVDGEFVKELRKGQGVVVSGRVVEIAAPLEDTKSRYFYFYLPEEMSCIIRIKGAADEVHELAKFSCR